MISVKYYEPSLGLCGAVFDDWTAFYEYFFDPELEIVEVVVL